MGDGAAIVLLGGGVLAGQFQHRRQVEMRQRQVRRIFQDQLKLRHRFVETAKREQSAAKIIARLDISGGKRHGCFKAGQRIRNQSVGSEDDAPVIVRLGEPWIEHDGAADQRCRIRTSQLVRDHPEQVKRPGIVRLRPADASVEAFGVGQAAGAMMSQRGSEHPSETSPALMAISQK